MTHRRSIWQCSFPTTMWTMIERAQRGDEASLNYCCRRYWKPCLAYYAKLGAKPDLAEELTQDVFMKLFTGEPLKTLKLRTSRFRSYLKRTLQNKWISWKRYSEAAVRHPPGGVASLQAVEDALGDNLMPINSDTPEAEFARQEAYGLLGIVIDEVQAHCEQRGDQSSFEIFAMRYLQDPPAAWEEIEAKFGVTREAASNQAKKVRKQLGRVLSAELPADVLSELIKVFQGCGGPCEAEGPKTDP